MLAVQKLSPNFQGGVSSIFFPFGGVSFASYVVELQLIAPKWVCPPEDGLGSGCILRDFRVSSCFFSRSLQFSENLLMKRAFYFSLDGIVLTALAGKLIEL